MLNKQQPDVDAEEKLCEKASSDFEKGILTSLIV